MANCIKCGKAVSDEESRARYEELCKQGIVPMMITICKPCRELPVKSWKEWAIEWAEGN